MSCVIISADMTQSGLCDLNIASDDSIAPMVVASGRRPPKRPFAEIDEDADEEPRSDELYGWIEDDEVAAEGLLIDEATLEDVNAARAGPVDIAHGRNKQVTRTSTV